MHSFTHSLTLSLMLSMPMGALLSMLPATTVRTWWSTSFSSTRSPSMLSTTAARPRSTMLPTFLMERSAWSYSLSQGLTQTSRTLRDVHHFT